MASQINPEDIKKMLHDGGELALLDVREDGEFGEGHILYANPCAYSHLEARVTDLGSGKAHSLDWESTLWESTVSGHRFWIWKCTD